MPLLSLPDEVIHLILDAVRYSCSARNTKTLAKVSRTCKKLRAAALPLLYDTIVLKRRYSHQSVPRGCNKFVQNVLKELNFVDLHGKEAAIQYKAVHARFPRSHVYVLGMDECEEYILDIWPNHDPVKYSLPGGIALEHAHMAKTPFIDGIKIHLPNTNALIPPFSPDWTPAVAHIHAEYEEVLDKVALPADLFVPKPT